MNNKNVVKRLKLDHPTFIKYEQLCEKANELGLSLGFSRYGEVILFDNNFPSREVYIKDAENGGNISSFPPDMEEKLIFYEETQDS